MIHKTTITTKVLLASLLIISGFISDGVLYRYMLVPNLSGHIRVPIYLLVGIYMPIIITLIATYFYIQDNINRAVIILCGTIGLQIFGYIAAILSLPGHFKSFAIESPLIYWVFGTAIEFIGYLLFVIIVGWIHNRARKLFNESAV